MRTIAVSARTRLALAAVLAGTALAPTLAQAELSGNIGVVSDYIVRGSTGPALEDDGAAVQGGIDWSGPMGLYAGYWGSSLGYADDGSRRGFENNLYAGWAGEFGPVSLSAGLLYYHYLAIDDADTPELILGAGYGPFSLGVKTLLDDVVWGNQGDTYITVGYAQALPRDFSASAVAGFYVYEDSGDYVTGGEDGFKHLDLSVTHPIGGTGADMSLTYIVGGDDRAGDSLDNAVVLGLKYGFDI